jgi:hypothetical protein
MQAPTRHHTPATLSAQRRTTSHADSQLALEETRDCPAEPQLELLEPQIPVFSEPGARLFWPPNHTSSSTNMATASNTAPALERKRCGHLVWDVSRSDGQLFACV